MAKFYFCLRRLFYSASFSSVIPESGTCVQLGLVLIIAEHIYLNKHVSEIKRILFSCIRVCMHLSTYLLDSLSLTVSHRSGRCFAAASAIVLHWLVISNIPFSSFFVFIALCGANRRRSQFPCATSFEGFALEFLERRRRRRRQSVVDC